MREQVLHLLKSGDGFVSGQEISETLGVSRTAVWKAVRQLKESGYTIEAVRNKGYKLTAEPDLLTEARIRSCLRTDWAGRQIRIFGEVDSTNNEARRQAEHGAEHGLLIAAQHQSAGKGRRGRSWESGAGEGIFMTLLLRPDIDPGRASMLTLVMALAVRAALADIAGLDAEIKWPNDIVCGGKKVCGILTEMSAQPDYINYIVIGVGINVHNGSFPEEIGRTATSVYLQTGNRICRDRLIAEVLNRFETYYGCYLKTQDLRELADEYNRYLINRGREVRVLDPRGDYTGAADGITDAGELIVRTTDGTRRVSSGEVSVRGVYGYI